MNYVDNPFQSPAVLSLCPGVRGLERGIERAIGRIRVVAYVEIEAFIIENLVCEMEQGLLAPAPVWSDIKTLNGEIVRGKIDGILGGYPCQPFSNAGERKGTDDPRHLYPFISGIIKAAGPVWCFFENVEGHLSLGYPEVSADLRSMGYAVEAGIYSAEEVGAPHQRDRLFILAIKRDYVENANSYATRSESRQIGRQNGIQILRQRDWKECPVRTTATSGENELADTQSELSELSELSGNSREWGTRPTDDSISEEKLANPNSERHIHSEFIQLPAPSRKQSFCDTPSDGEQEYRKELAHAHAHGSRSRENREQGELRATGTIEPPGHSGSDNTRENNQGGFQRWPARPGEPQYEWEEPRVKSRLGSTINGYNFREDLLRAYGNSVVEQTAEIAFLDLLSKHFNQGTSRTSE